MNRMQNAKLYVMKCSGGDYYNMQRSHLACMQDSLNANDENRRIVELIDGMSDETNDRETCERMAPF